MIRCQGVGFGWGTEPVLERVSHDFTVGQATAIIGPNGAGKSTLLHLCAGLLRPSEGRLDAPGELGGSLWEAAPAQLARWRAFVGQRAPAVFGFSVEQAVSMGLRHTGWLERWRGRAGGEALERALAAMELCGLRDRSVAELSGGELQRVMVARALIAGAPWWMWDEPTSELDPRHAKGVMERVRGHCDGGGGAIVVLHDLNLVGAYFDQVVVIRQGHVVAAGGVKEVLTEEVLSEAFEVGLRQGAPGGWTLR